MLSLCMKDEHLVTQDKNDVLMSMVADGPVALRIWSSIQTVFDMYLQEILKQKKELIGVFGETSGRRRDSLSASRARLRAC